MTYIQFQQLHKKEQSGIVNAQGLFLSKRETSSYHIMLYQVYNFCVEVYLDKQSNTVISCNSIYFN